MPASDSIIRTRIKGESLALLMGVPEARRVHYVSWLQSAVFARWRETMKPPEKPAGWRRAEINAEISKNCRALMRAIEQRRGYSTPADYNMLKAVDEYLQHERRPHHRAPKRADKLSSFLHSLCTLTYMLGGRVSFDRKAGKENVVDLLENLRPHMPPGFIPKALPMALMERLFTKARRMVRDVGGDPNELADITMQVLETIREENSQQDGVCVICGQSRR